MNSILQALTEPKEFITFGFGQVVGPKQLGNHYMKINREETKGLIREQGGVAIFAFSYPLDQLQNQLDRFNLIEITPAEYLELKDKYYLEGIRLYGKEEVITDHSPSTLDSGLSEPQAGGTTEYTNSDDVPLTCWHGDKEYWYEVSDHDKFMSLLDNL